MSDTSRHYLAAALAAVAVVMLAAPSEKAPPSPDVPTKLVLSGKFVGPTAAEDAASIAALCDELARAIEADGEKEQPRLKNGVQLDELRVIAREARTRGVSIGQRQPNVRDEIRHFLDEVVGVSGGPINHEQRAKWVDAMFEVSKAASNAAGK
jgi:hypothetical protein